MSGAGNRIRLAIVDDDLLIVQLLCDYFKTQGHMEVCMTAQGGIEFLNMIEATDDAPDIVLLDLKMKNGSGMETLTALPQIAPRIKPIVLTSYYSDAFTGQMLKLNAAAFLPKDISCTELVPLIETVFRQGHYFSTTQILILRDQISSKIPRLQLAVENVLSEREREVLILVCHQYTTLEIADRLFVSPKTIESHKSNLLVKTGAKNMAGLVMYAVQNQIVDPSQIILLDR